MASRNSKSTAAGVPSSPIHSAQSPSSSSFASSPHSNSSGAKSGENVKVVCRVRPPNAREIREGGTQCVKVQTSSIEVTVDEAPISFHFDRVFGQESTQVGVFEYAALPLIADVLAGYNATIFAYGQTGTGKTHTMEGNIHSSDLKGIIPRSVEALFQGVAAADANIEFVFKVSYVEIYLEKIRDLLDNTRTKTNLNIREDKLKGIYIADVTEEYVASHEELLSIMSSGAKNRATAATGMNEGSSRSHSVFTITVSQTNDVTGSVKSGKLVLVDLAGSEMVRKTNASGQQLEEAKMINKSLSALGQVIFALTDDKQTHIPYRDSKLTRILQDSLGGNAKTVLIIAVSPSSFNAPETVSTLRFGMRAKSIQNKATINQSRSAEELEILLGRAEATIADLTSKLAARENSSSNVSNVLATPEKSASGDLISSSPVVSLESITVEEGKVVERVVSSENDELNINKMKILESEYNEKFEKQQRVIDELNKKIESLSNELDEDAIFFENKDIEIAEYKSKLSDNEKLFREGAEMMNDLQSRVELYRDKSEVLNAEKLNVMGELEVLRGQFSDRLASVRYELMESELMVSKLKQDMQLFESFGSFETGLGNDISGESSLNSSPQNKGSRRRSVEPNSLEHATSDGQQPYKINVDLHRGQFNALIAEFSVDRDASERIWSLIETVIVQYEQISLANESKVNMLESSKKEIMKRLKVAEVEKLRLEGELNAINENESLLKSSADGSQDKGEHGYRTMDANERSSSKALQQRLEQLVVVHQALLLKYTTAELDVADLKKKLQSRDDCIMGLKKTASEQNTLALLQSERHVAELVNLREQIQLLRSDHQLRLARVEAEKDSIFRRFSSSRGNHKSVRGGNVKSVRGGGSEKRSSLSVNFDSINDSISNSFNSLFSSSNSNNSIFSNSNGTNSSIFPNSLTASSLFSSNSNSNSNGAQSNEDEQSTQTSYDGSNNKEGGISDVSKGFLSFFRPNS